MRIDHFLTVPVTVTTRTQTGEGDRYGTPTWVTDTFNTLTWVHPVASEEQVQRPAGTVKYYAYFAEGTPIGTHARLTIDGYGQLEVAAPPRKWRNPRGRGFEQVELVEVDA